MLALHRTMNPMSKFVSYFIIMVYRSFIRHTKCSDKMTLDVGITFKITQGFHLHIIRSLKKP